MDVGYKGVGFRVQCMWFCVSGIGFRFQAVHS